MEIPSDEAATVAVRCDAAAIVARRTARLERPLHNAAAAHAHHKDVPAAAARERAEAGGDAQDGRRRCGLPNDLHWQEQMAAAADAGVPDALARADPRWD